MLMMQLFTVLGILTILLLNLLSVALLMYKLHKLVINADKTKFRSCRVSVGF